MLFDLSEEDLRILVSGGSKNPLIQDTYLEMKLTANLNYKLPEQLKILVARIFTWANRYGIVYANSVITKHNKCTCGHATKDIYKAVWVHDRELTLCNKCFKLVVETVFFEDYENIKGMAQWSRNLTNRDPYVICYPNFSCSCGWSGNILETKLHTSPRGLDVGLCPKCNSGLVKLETYDLRVS